MRRIDLLRRLGTALSVIGIAVVLPGSAVAATTYPASDGSAGPCNLSVPINTTTGTGLPVAGTSVIPPSGGSPGIRVVNCTTITETGTVVVSGSNALDLRATGAVSIQGILDGSGLGGSSLNAGGPGGGSGQTGTSSMVTGGPGVGGLGESGDGGAAATGGAPGVAYGGGVSGVIGSSALNSTDGAGGGGAGSGELSGALASFAIARGSGGGAGGTSMNLASGGTGGGGGGAIRIISTDQIQVGAAGVIRAKGGDGQIGGGSSGQFGGSGGGGSGGVIVLIAPTVNVNATGFLNANHGLGGTGSGPADGGNGAVGSVHTLANVFQVFSTPGTEAETPYSDQIDAAVFGTGSGSIASSPAGINCPSDCSEPYDPGATVTLTATPAAGSVLSAWTGACASAGTAPQCTLALNGNTVMGATFAPAAGAVPATGGPGKKKCKKKKKHAAAAKKCKKKKK
jgi:hypothetical protein